MADRLLKAADVARILNVSQRAVTEWAVNGRLPGIRTPGGHWRFKESVIRAMSGDESFDEV